jgi:hypothetical protein
MPGSQAIVLAAVFRAPRGRDHLGAARTNQSLALAASERGLRSNET